MKNKEKILFRFSNKILYLVFTVFISYSVGGYIYNFQDYITTYRVEWVFTPKSIDNKACYCYFSKQVQHNIKVNVDRERINFKYLLVHHEKELNNRLLQQSLKCCLFPVIKLYPSNKYHNDSEDDELSIIEFFS